MADDLGVRLYFTDAELPGGERAILRDHANGCYDVFVNRAELLADPEGVMRLVVGHFDENTQAYAHLWKSRAS